MTRNGSETKVWASTTAAVVKAIRIPAASRCWPEQPEPAEGVQQRDTADDGRQHQGQQDERAQPTHDAGVAAREHQRHRYTEEQAGQRARERGLQAQQQRGRCEDRLLIRLQKFGQSTLSAIATSGSTTNTAPTAAGT